MSSIISFLLSQFVCCHLARRPFQVLQDPGYYGLDKTEHQTIPVLDSKDEYLGAWFSSPLEGPQSSKESCDAKQGCSTPEGEKLIVGADKVVVLYLHGNADTRSQFHRRELQILLQKLNYYVLSIDYRGYGDSTFLWTPNETTLAHDALSAYFWLTERVHPDSRVIVWGHSLGTAITTRLSSLITKRQLPRPESFILETPFSNMLEEIQSFRISILIPFNLKNALSYSQMEFDNENYIKSIKEPILILHGEDDGVVSYELGMKLFTSSKDTCDVTFHTFDGSHGHGHSNLYQNGNFSDIVDNFVQGVAKKQRLEKYQSK